MYIEASSPRNKGDNAKLVLSVSGNGALACLEFYYHMYGASMGSLTVLSGNAVVFNISGNQGSTWEKASRTIYLSNTVSCVHILNNCRLFKSTANTRYLCIAQNVSRFP